MARRTPKPSDEAIKKLTDEEIASAALARVAPLAQGRKMTNFAALAARYNVSETRMKAYFVEAFHRRLVEVVPGRLSITRLPDLEQSFRESFGVPAIIVDFGKDDSVDSSPIHDGLGRALAAEILRTPLWIRSGDSVALGSGRACRAVVRELENLGPLMVDRLSVYSTTGSMFDAGHVALGDILSDANYHALAFANTVHGKAGIDLHRIEALLATGAPRKQLVKNTWLEKEDMHPHRLTHAISGVGVFGPGHRMRDGYIALRAGHVATPSPVLHALLPELKKLTPMVERIAESNPGHIAVADLCHRMYPVPPVPGRKMSAKDRAFIDNDITEVVNSLNDKLLTITKTQLSKIPFVCIVAGTSIKAPALYWLLRRRTQGLKLVDQLVTDAATARQLLIWRTRELAGTA